jgi:hypothetical protein
MLVGGVIDCRESAMRFWRVGIEEVGEYVEVY